MPHMLHSLMQLISCCNVFPASLDTITYADMQQGIYLTPPCSCSHGPGPTDPAKHHWQPMQTFKERRRLPSSLPSPRKPCTDA